jgi:hypothetical protein
LDQLPDLTDKAAQAVVTLKDLDNFNSEYMYDVSVKNLSSDPLVGESLVLVLDKITNIGGDEWSSGTSESNLSRMEILGQDGETDDAKPYFGIPRGAGRAGSAALHRKQSCDRADSQQGLSHRVPTGFSGLWDGTDVLPTETEGTCAAIASSQDSHRQINSDAHSERPAI